MTEYVPTYLEQKRDEAIRQARMAESEQAVRRAVAKGTAIDMKQALKCGTALGRRPRSMYVPD